MAWSRLALRNTHFAAARRLAARTSAVLGNSAAFLESLRKRGTVPRPLLLAIRSANQLAQLLVEQRAPSPTPAQRRVLLAAATQIRTAAAGILGSDAARDPESVESALAELISRTLLLIDQVTAEVPTFDASEVAPKGKLEE
jgi:hypothetical protein